MKGELFSIIFYIMCSIGSSIMRVLLQQNILLYQNIVDVDVGANSTVAEAQFALRLILGREVKFDLIFENCVLTQRIPLLSEYGIEDESLLTAVFPPGSNIHIIRLTVQTIGGITKPFVYFSRT